MYPNWIPMHLRPIITYNSEALMTDSKEAIVAEMRELAGSNAGKPYLIARMFDWADRLSRLASAQTQEAAAPPAVSLSEEEQSALDYFNEDELMDWPYESEMTEFAAPRIRTLCALVRRLAQPK